jgi:hypothetical protein
MITDVSEKENMKYPYSAAVYRNIAAVFLP